MVRSMRAVMSAEGQRNGGWVVATPLARFTLSTFLRTARKESVKAAEVDETSDIG